MGDLSYLARKVLGYFPNCYTDTLERLTLIRYKVILFSIRSTRRQSNFVGFVGISVCSFSYDLRKLKWLLTGNSHSITLAYRGHRGLRCKNLRPRKSIWHWRIEQGVARKRAHLVFRLVASSLHVNVTLFAN